jgi:hypothetical protein
MDFGAGFVANLSDVRMAGNDIRLSYGIPGGGPTDRVAAPGTLSFALENVANSGSVVGYYSPNHASKRPGFALGMKVRLSVVSGGVTYYKFYGTLDKVAPVAGRIGRVAQCVAVDWMSEASRYLISGVPAALGTDAKAVLQAIVAAVPKQPNATSYGNGSDAYAYAPAAKRDERYSAISECQRVAMSELGLIVMRGGTSAGTAGTFTFLSRAQLVQSPYNVSQVTLTDTMRDMGAEVSRESVLNVFRMQTHGARVDPTSSDPVVLYAMPQAVNVEGGAASITVLGQYSDPAQQAASVSGYNMYGAAGQPAMVNGTDYYFNSAADGLGTDLSANLTMTPSPGSEGVRYVVSATVSGFFWAQARGFGIYDYDPVTVEQRDAASVTTYGENPIDLDLAYQGDPSFGKGVGVYLLPYFKDSATIVPSVTFLANYSSTHMLHALAREPGDVVTIAETTTGVNKLFRIMFVYLVFRNKLIYCTWGLSPMVDVTDYWVLEEGGSALGTNTVLGL